MKADGAMLTIGEVTRRTGVPPHVLRYWERHVPALRPMRRAGARRYYRPEDVALIERLQRLVREDRYTLDGAARAVGSRTAGSEAPPLVTSVDLIPLMDSARSEAVEKQPTPDALDLTHLRRIRDRLAEALEASSPGR